MSHLIHRHDQLCLNCRETVIGPYCHRCGQQYKQYKYGFWHLFQHFVSDVLHFDGKFFQTLKILLSQPGKVPREYTQGRKTAYLDPIRMYLFLSAVTFFLFPLFLNVQDNLKNLHVLATPRERLSEAARNFAYLNTDSSNVQARRNLTVLLDTSVHLLLKPGTDTNLNSIPIEIDRAYKGIPMRDSVIFPERNWLEERISRRIKQKFDKEGEDLNRLIILQSKVQFKLLPYVLFLSLPLFSFFLQAMFSRRKGYFYSDHAVFTLYHYIVAFIILLVCLILSVVVSRLGADVLYLVYMPSIFLLLLYLFLGMKYFYRESWSVTAVKFLGMTVASFVIFAVLYIGLLLLSLLL